MPAKRSHRSDHPRSARPARIALTSLRRVAKATRSGLKRYPKALLESFNTEIGAPRFGRAAAALPDVSRHDLAALWLGHAGTLIRVGGLNILTDPVLTDRIGPRIAGVTIGLPRLGPAAIAPADLPPIDLVLLSHAHFDHLDKPTLRAIASPQTTVVTARRTARLIPRGFGRVVELDWTERLRFKGLDLSAIRPAHWGARAALDRRRGYNSYLIRSDAGGVLFAGDTAYTEAFDRLPGVNLAVFGIGSYEPWEHAHATPEQTWSMFRAIGGGAAGRLLPVHHSTFPMGDEPIGDPMRRLLAAAGTEAHRIIQAAPGELWTG